MKHQSKLNHQLVVILLTLFSILSFRAQSKPSQLDNLLSSVYDSKRTGASILVSKKGKILYERQYGLGNLESKSKVGNRTKFQVGSLTKQITAAAIMLLQERGKLNTSDYIGTYLKEFDTDTYPIKIEHLLTHTSGLRSGIPAGYKTKKNAAEIPPKKFASFLSASKLLFTPGHKFEYSNNGYILLGLIVEVVSNKAYKDFISTNIFRPLKMNNSIVASKDSRIDNMASGYVRDDDDNLAKTTKYTSSFSAGAIVSTPRDMAKWVNGLFNGQIINKASRTEMFRNYRLANGEMTNVGYGWEINKVREYQSFEHSGSEPGFKTNSIYIPEKDIYVIVCQNTEEGSPTPPSVKATSIMLGKPYPKDEDGIALNNGEVSKFLGTYLLPNGKERYVGHNEEFGLFYKAPGGKKRKLYALDDNTLYFSGGYALLKFKYNKTDGGYQKFIYHNRILTSTADKISNTFPEENVVIKLDPPALKKYIGTYVSEQFTMLISYEDNSLYAQPDGSDKLELKPKGERTFFIKEIGAEIEFKSDEDSDYINIILEGNIMKGIKQ